MQKCLYFLCPTDCLETVINKKFQQENYFYTSLGNSLNADDKTLNNLKYLIQKHHIRKIYFVLANDNKIVADALKHQDFSDINGIETLYTEITRQKEQSKIVWQQDDPKLSVLSCYLNEKIKKLRSLLASSIKINGKIYDRNAHTFTNIYPNLVCFEKHQLN